MIKKLEQGSIRECFFSVVILTFNYCMTEAFILGVSELATKYLIQ